jgi:hypothetical protein
LTIRDKIEAKAYTTKLPWATHRNDPAASKAYRDDNIRLMDEFKKDLLEDLGITNHPKAEIFFSKVWDHAHSSGLMEVLNYAEDLVELIQ